MVILEKSPFSTINYVSLIETIRHEFGKKLDLEDNEIAVSKAFEDYLRASKKQVIKNPIGYALTSARHESLKQIRRQKHERPIAELTQESDAHDETQTNLEAEDMRNAIFSRLQRSYCEVLKLTSDGYGVSEIAKMTGRSVAATYKLKERAQKRFLEIKDKLDPPTIIMPIKIKINRKYFDFECRIWRVMWPFSTVWILKPLFKISHEELYCQSNGVTKDL